MSEDLMKQSISVAEAISLFNQTLDYAYPVVTIVGEVSQYKVSKGKWVYFDIKDSEASLNCFTTVYQQRMPLDEGMMVKVVARPNITKWGRFSLVVQSATPVGEGSLKKSFEMLKKKLESEGLFEVSRKRNIPDIPERVAVISSSGASGYKDFIKILGNRWGGMKIDLADVQVQGQPAPGQIVRAIDHFTQSQEQYDVLVLVRGGGSADDLAAFSDEEVVRKIAGSRIPVVVGVGHEPDVTLAGLAADLRASTPSNAAELISPDKEALIATLGSIRSLMLSRLEQEIDSTKRQTRLTIELLISALREPRNKFDSLRAKLELLSPQNALTRGYSLVLSNKGKLVSDIGSVDVGDKIEVELSNGKLGATVDAKQKTKR